MKSCTVCGHANDEAVRFCVACGAPFEQRPDDATTRELEHIAWLLQRLPEWRSRGWISPGNAGTLYREYARRREQLLARPPGEAGAVATEPAATGHETEPTVPASHAEPVAGKTASLGRGLAEFAEEHWLKLLAVLAAALIVAGMRQFLDFEWVSRMAVLLIPIVPLTLSVLLLRYGLATRDYERTGSRAACSVGIVLAMFAVTSVNRRWLNFAIPAEWCLAVGSFVSMAVGTFVRVRTCSPFYEHFVFGGAAATTLLTMNAAMPVAGSEAKDAWRYAVGLAAVGLLSLTWAVTTRRRAGGPVAAGGIPMLWGHLCFAATGALSLIPLLAGSATAGLAVATVGVSALGYIVSAAALNDTSLAAGASLGITLCGILLLDTLGLLARPDGWTYLFIVVGLVGTALSLGEEEAR